MFQVMLIYQMFFGKNLTLTPFPIWVAILFDQKAGSVSVSLVANWGAAEVYYVLFIGAGGYHIQYSCQWKLRHCLSFVLTIFRFPCYKIII